MYLFNNISHFIYLFIYFLIIIIEQIIEAIIEQNSFRIIFKYFQYNDYLYLCYVKII